MIGRLISLGMTLALIYFVWHLIDPESLGRFMTNMGEAINKTFG